MQIDRYDSGLLSSNMFVIKENGHAVVIDPSTNVSVGQGLLIDLLIITHEHYDHISGVNIWEKTYNAPLLCSEICGKRITDSPKNQAHYFEVFCEIQDWIQIKHLPVIESEYVCHAENIY